MSISLKKGQKVNLSKDHVGLETIMVGLGWDEISQGKKHGMFKSFLGGGSSEQIDCDASAIMLIEDKFTSQQDVVYFANLHHKSNSVIHRGDNLTGVGAGDDEQIMIDLSQVPSIYNKIIIVVNIFRGAQKGQHFGMLQNAFIRLVDCKTQNEICKYELTEQYNGMTAMVFGELYKYNGEWKFTAVGQATQDKDIPELCQRFR